MKGTGKIWFSLVVFVLCACRTVPENITSSDVKVHTGITGHIVRDSVFVHDSIYVRERPDTVFFTRYRTLYKENVVRDTVLLYDTLYKERIVTRYTAPPGCVNVEWMWLAVPIGILLLIIAPKVIRLLLKFFVGV